MRNIKIEVLWMLGALAAPQALNFIFLILATHSLEPHVFGQVSYILLLSGLISGISDIGTKDFFLTENAKKHSLGSGNFYLKLSSIGAFSCISIMLISMINSGSELEKRLAFIIIPEILATSILSKKMLLFFQGQGNTTSFSRKESMIRVASGSLRIIVFIISGEVEYAIAASSLMIIFAYAIWYIRNKKNQDSNFRKSKETFKSFFKAWRHWYPYALINMAYLAYTSWDRVILKGQAGSEALALYSAAFAFVAIGQLAATAFWNVMMPKIIKSGRAFISKEELFAGLTLGFVTTVVYIIFAEFLFSIFFRFEYVEAKNILIILSFYFLFRFVNVLLEAYLLSADRYVFFMRFRVLIAVVSIIGNFIFAGYYGSKATAAIFACSEAILFVCLTIFSRDKPVNNVAAS